MTTVIDAEMTIGPDDGGTLTTAADDEAAAGRSGAVRASHRRSSPQAEPRRRAARRGRLGSIAGLLVLIVFSFVTVGVTVATHAALSPIDEAAHIDSVFRAPSIVRTGELMLPQTLDEISCRGSPRSSSPRRPVGCSRRCRRPGYAIGGGGYNTADIHPPIYYDITKLAITARRLAPAGPGHADAADRRDLARAGCLPDLAARPPARRRPVGRVRRRRDAGRRYSVQQMSSIVNVDAMVLATGAGFALLALWAWPRRLAWWLIPLAAVLVMFVKMTNIAGLVVVCLFLLIREVSRPLADW